MFVDSIPSFTLTRTICGSKDVAGALNLMLLNRLHPIPVITMMSLLVRTSTMKVLFGLIYLQLSSPHCSRCISTSVDGEVIDIGTVKDASNIDNAMDVKEWLIL